MADSDAVRAADRDAADRDTADRDAAARERALDPGRSVVLEAPAGSGKTTVLTQRILRLLCTVGEPEQILAITFTRKAAAEMRERVMRALSGDIDPSTAQGRKLHELAEAARERSRRLEWSLEANPGRLRIQTIDSLNRWLASRLPLAARGAGDLAIAEAPERLYRIAARRTLLDAESEPGLAADAELLFERLDNDFGRFEQLLTGMLQARAHWLPKLLRSGVPASVIGESAIEESALEIDLCARVERGLDAVVSAQLRKAEAVIPGALIAQGERLACEAAQRRLEVEGAGTEGAGGEGSLGLRGWQGLSRLALTGQGTWRVSLTKREGFPAEARPLKEEALRWIGSLSRIAGAREILAEIAALPEARIPVEDARALSALARLLRLAASELELAFQESGRVDYPYIAAAARRALTEEGAPTDLALRLGADVRHILVDEFQDTSIEQAALLEALTAGWEAGDGRSLFVVGDPMQSIYQFREAEVGLFLRAATQGIGALRLEPLALTRNFRAAPALVSWLNATFPRCFPPLDDPRTSAVRYRECTAGREDREGGARRDGLGTVRLHATPSGDPEAEARAIAELVARMREEEPAASIAVLLAARSHAPPIVAALRDARIPVAGVDLVALDELPVVRDLEALARALDHLADRTAWLAVLRAPWCGLTIAELSALVESATESTVWEAINDEKRVGRLPPDSRARLARTRAVLARALARRDRRAPASWLETTWLQLGGPAACRDDADIEHAQTFFAGLARWSSEPDWTGPLGLEERLEQLYARHAGAPASAVQIMTIHRAKGLEFDKVIVPALGRRLRSGPEPLLRWLELPGEREGGDLLMAAIPSPLERGSELSEYLKRLQTERAAHERVRLLYVAATRARGELHLFGEVAAPPVPRGDSARHGGAGGEARGGAGGGAGGARSDSAAPVAGSLLAALWPAIGAEFPREALPQPAPEPAPEPESAPAVAPAGRAASDPALIRLPADWCLPELPPDAGAEAPVVRVAAHDASAPEESEEAIVLLRPELATAQVVCDQLRRCARGEGLPAIGGGISPAGRIARALRARLARLGFTGSELEEHAQQAAALFDACLADSALQWIFASHAHAEGPLALTGVHEGRLTSLAVDRSFVDGEGVRWLIDFRADSPSPQHDRELAKRIALAGAVAPAEAVALAGTGAPDGAVAPAGAVTPAAPVRAAIYFPAARRLYEPARGGDRGSERPR